MNGRRLGFIRVCRGQKQSGKIVIEGVVDGAVGVIPAGGDIVAPQRVKP